MSSDDVQVVRRIFQDPAIIDTMLAEHDRALEAYEFPNVYVEPNAGRLLLDLFWRYPEPMDAAFFKRPYSAEELLDEATDPHGITALEQRIHRWACLRVACDPAQQAEDAEFA